MKRRKLLLWDIGKVVGWVRVQVRSGRGCGL